LHVPKKRRPPVHQQDPTTVAPATPEPRKEYAKLAWRPEDVQSLREDMTEDEARGFLARNEKHMRDRLCELGFDVMETFLTMEGK